MGGPSEAKVDSSNTSHPSEMDNEVKRTSAWAEFVDGTTLHGFKYIFEAPSPIRRVIWLLVILGALSIVTMQVYVRSIDYLEYETNVDLQVVYDKEVTFPAVTVCNQNNMRLTALADLSVYGFVMDVYDHASNTTGFNFSMHGLDVLDADTFLRETAHQKNDLIESCYWKGEPCDVDKDFVTVLTDLGVCYTFNSGDNDSVLTLDESGSAAGLSMVLNVEQYEFTHSRQQTSDAGVKILLHDQSEVPLIKDRGFAASPGAHTLVAINTAEVENLADPYGTCYDDAPAMSECLSDCETLQTVDRCGCRAPHMKNIGVPPADVCSVEEYFGCIQRDGGDAGNNTDTACDCSQPCERTTYEASLSYAQLSHFNIERTVLGDKTRQEAVWDRQYKARETFQRVDKVAVRGNQNEYDDLLTNTENLKLLTTEMRGNFTEDQIFEMLQRISDGLFHDVEQIMFASTHGYDLTRAHYYDYLGPLERSSTSVYSYLPNSLGIGSNPRLSDQLNDCLAVYSSGTGDTAVCDSLFDRSFREFEYYRGEVEKTYEGFPATRDNYVQMIIAMYANSPISPSNVTEHVQCMAGYEAVISSSGALLEVSNALDDVLNTTSSDAFVQAVQSLTDLVSSTQIQDLNTLVANAVVRCQWLENYYKADFYYEYIPYKDTIQYEQQQTSNVPATVATFVLPALTIMEETLGDVITPIVDTTRLYMDRHIQRLELFNRLRNPTYKGASGDLDLAGVGLLQHVITLVSDLETIESSIVEAFQHLFELKVPVTNTEQFGRTSALLALARYADASIPVPNDAAAMTDIVHKVYDQVLDPIRDMRSRLQGMPPRLSNTLTQQQNRLQQFVTGIRMDNNFYKSNFLKVDIYYKELKYDMITQFPAFEFVTLLGEVGGFLGLLLGASAMTAVELLDFIALKGFEIFCRKGKSRPAE